MIRFNGTVTYSGRDEADTFTVGPMAQVAWERYAQRSGLPTDGSTVPMTYATYIAYAAVTRGKKQPPSFEAWCDQVDDVTLEAEAANPTPAEAPEG